jgi:RNA methyltransferase, TrmH family
MIVKRESLVERYEKNICCMLSKNDVKYIQSLCHKRQRDEDKLFIAEGPKMVEEILNSNFEIVQVYAVNEWLNENRHVSAPVTEISHVELEKISTLQTPNKVVVVARQKQLQNEPVLSGKVSIVLDGIQDPGNLGTIIRIADWFGIDQLIASNDTADVYNAKVVQSTMGSICRVSVWYKSLPEWFAGIKAPVYGALLNGKSIYETAKVEEGIIVIGNESKGIREGIIERVTHPVTIPRFGGAESLNAAVATGIIVSHLVAK